MMIIIPKKNFMIIIIINLKMPKNKYKNYKVIKIIIKIFK